MKQGYTDESSTIHAIIEADYSRVCDGKVFPVTLTDSAVSCERCLEQMKSFVPPTSLIDKMIDATKELIKAIKRDGYEKRP